MQHPTWMARETREAPEAVARLLAREAGTIARIGDALRRLDPPVLLTCARGSSDHAAGFLKYGVEILLGRPVASMGPSIASLYEAPLRLAGTAMVTISQSGQSPDIVALQRAARQAGALTIAIVNVAPSPVAEEADFVLPLHCGTETSVAATKTMIASCAAGLAILAAWSGDAALNAAIQRLPSALTMALEQDWTSAAGIAEAGSLYTLGRGPSLPMAAEAALKLKETAALHVEAFSGAEVMHGPLQLVGPGFPVIAFAQDDRAHPAMATAVSRLIAAGADVHVASALPIPGKVLPFRATGHGLTDPLAMIQSFYLLAERVARARGHDPDRPSRLLKVTETH